MFVCWMTLNAVKLASHKVISYRVTKKVEFEQSYGTPCQSVKFRTKYATAIGCDI